MYLVHLEIVSVKPGFSVKIQITACIFFSVTIQVLFYNYYIRQYVKLAG